MTKIEKTRSGLRKAIKLLQQSSIEHASKESQDSRTRESIEAHYAYAQALVDISIQNFEEACLANLPPMERKP